MKKISIILFAAAVLAAGCKQHDGYTVNGVIAGADGDSVYLKIVKNDVPPVTIDSAVVKNGKFTLQGKVAAPDFVLLYVGKNGPVPFFIENATIDVAVTLDSLAGSTVTGSNENNLFNYFNEEMDKYGQQSKKINDEYYAQQLSDKPDTAIQAVLFARMDSLMNVRTAFIDSLVRANPQSVVSAFILANILTRMKDISEYADIIEGYDADHPSQWVQGLQKKYNAQKGVAIGKPFIDLTMNDPDGKEVKLSDYAGKGKFILVDFWASWCRPCREANPTLVLVYNKFKNKDFDIVGVSLDRDKNAWVKAIADDHLTWHHMSDLKFWESAGAKAYFIQSIPNSVLLDKDGKIIKKGVHPSELEEILKSVISL